MYVQFKAATELVYFKVCTTKYGLHMYIKCITYICETNRYKNQENSIIENVKIIKEITFNIDLCGFKYFHMDEHIPLHS